MIHGAVQLRPNGVIDVGRVLSQAEREQYSCRKQLEYKADGSPLVFDVTRIASFSRSARFPSYSSSRLKQPWAHIESVASLCLCELWDARPDFVVNPATVSLCIAVPTMFVLRLMSGEWASLVCAPQKDFPRHVPAAFEDAASGALATPQGQLDPFTQSGCQELADHRRSVAVPWAHRSSNLPLD